MAEYSVLGPLEVRVADGLVPITGRSERVVLAALVAWGGVVVRREQLDEALWGDEPPRSATKVVQNIVLRLRRVLGSSAIATLPGGYVLPAASDAVDVRQFERLVGEGRSAASRGDWEASAAPLRAAMALWRGSPLDELHHWPPGRWVAARLEEEHRCVAEELSEAELACGRHREQLATLTAMVAEEPLRERRWALLLLALYQSGQQAEALRTYQRAVTTLAALGLTPGAELREVEQAISRRALPVGPEVLARLRRGDRPGPIPSAGAAEGSDSRPTVTAGISAGNLPSPLTSFVGRVADVAGVISALRERRLVTVSGAGGVGKTRLAVRVGSDVSRDYPGGAWFCRLATAATAEELSHVVAAAVGARVRANRTVERSIVDRLRPSRLLLVLDNCEHLLAAAGGFAQLLLESCPELRILATSRRPLGVAGEQAWPLDPLSVPGLSDLDPAADSEAVELFADRARSAKPSFTISPVNAPAVHEICRQLDGIPLAIELAAARVAAMTPAEIATDLDGHLRAARGAPGGMDDRHRTMRATLDWSYSLLEDDERLVFDRLGVFSGRFEAAAAVSVAACATVGPPEVREILGALVGQSMVTADDSSGNVTRYYLLETFRRYALEHLDACGVTSGMRREHARHYAKVAEDTGRGLRGAEELVWRARFRADRDNLRAAVRWSLSAESAADRAYGLRIIAALAHESMQEGEPIGISAEGALLHADPAPGDTRAAVLASAAWFAHRSGDMQLAREHAIAAIREGLSPVAPSPELAYFVLALTAMADHTDPMDIFDEAHRALDAAGGDDYGHVFLWSAALFMQVIVGDIRHQTAGAEALRTARHLGNPSLLIRLLCNRAALVWLDDPNTARRELEEAERLAESGASSHMLGFGWPILARLHTQRDDLEGARSAMAAAVARSQEDNDPFILATALDRGIHVLEDLRHPEGAAVWAGAVVDGDLSRTTFLPARERPLRSEAIERLKTTLGRATYQAAAARGARMSDHDLIRHAFVVLGG